MAGKISPRMTTKTQNETVNCPPRNKPAASIWTSVLARKPMKRWMMKKISTMISTRSIMLMILRSLWSFDIHMITAAPVDMPETKNSGPSKDVLK